MNQADTFATLKDISSNIQQQHGFMLILPKKETKGAFSIQDLRNGSENVAVIKYNPENEGSLSIQQFVEPLDPEKLSIALNDSVDSFIGNTKEGLKDSGSQPAKAMETLCQGLRHVLTLAELAKKNSKFATWEFSLSTEGKLFVRPIVKEESESNVLIPTPMAYCSFKGPVPTYHVGTNLRHDTVPDLETPDLTAASTQLRTLNEGGQDASDFFAGILGGYEGEFLMTADIKPSQHRGQELFAIVEYELGTTNIHLLESNSGPSTKKPVILSEKEHAGKNIIFDMLAKFREGRTLSKGFNRFALRIHSK